MASKLSFITPKRRKYLDLESKILIVFLIVIGCIIIAFAIFLSVQALAKSSNTKSMQKEIAQMEVEIESYVFEYSQIKELQLKADEVYTANELLRGSIRNLFDLIPDQITLSKSILSPLKSIFHENRTTFYSLENGWYRFVSVNVLHDVQGLTQ